MGQNTGHFITVEGIEGVGKSTNIDFIRHYLESASLKVRVTREPGGTRLGEEVREILLAHRHDNMSSDTELLLMFAARAEHIAHVIKPALEAGEWVLCDRFTDATYAYQGGGRGIAMERITVLEDWVQSELRPDLTLLLDVPVETGLQRANERNEADRFEKEQTAFFERVREAYLAMAKRNPQRFRVIDASRTLEDVQEQISRVLSDYLKEIVE